MLRNTLCIKQKIQHIYNMLEVEEIKSKHGCVGLEHVVSCILHLENISGKGIILCSVKQGLSGITTEQGTKDMRAEMEIILQNDACIK